MEGEFRYRGRVITAAEVESIRQLITQHPGANRRQLSLRLCEAWGWRQANGALRDATHGYTASQIMFAALGFLGLVFSILLLRADRHEGGRLERAK